MARWCDSSAIFQPRKDLPLTILETNLVRRLSRLKADNSSAMTCFEVQLGIRSAIHKPQIQLLTSFITCSGMHQEWQKQEQKQQHQQQLVDHPCSTSKTSLTALTALLRSPTQPLVRTQVANPDQRDWRTPIKPLCDLVVLVAVLVVNDLLYWSASCESCVLHQPTPTPTNQASTACYPAWTIATPTRCCLVLKSPDLHLGQNCWGPPATLVKYTNEISRVNLDILHI